MPAENDVVLNPGVGGSLIRTAEITTSAGVVEQQVVVHADAAGSLPGDGRQQPLMVSDPAMQEVIAALRRVEIALLQLTACASPGSWDSSFLEPIVSQII